MTRTETVLASKKYHRFDLQIERIINKKSESSAHKKAQEIGAALWIMLLFLSNNMGYLSFITDVYVRTTLLSDI